MILDLEQFVSRGQRAQQSADAIIATANNVLAGKPPVKIKLKYIVSGASCDITCNVPFPCPLCGVVIQGHHKCERKGKP